MQGQIAEMERQLAQCRATARAAQRDRDEVTTANTSTRKDMLLTLSLLTSPDQAKDAEPNHQFERGVQTRAKPHKIITGPCKLPQDLLQQHLSRTRRDTTRRRCSAGGRFLRLQLLDTCTLLYHNNATFLLNIAKLIVYQLIPYRFCRVFIFQILYSVLQLTKSIDK